MKKPNQQSRSKRFHHKNQNRKNTSIIVVVLLLLVAGILSFLVFAGDAPEPEGSQPATDRAASTSTVESQEPDSAEMAEDEEASEEDGNNTAEETNDKTEDSVAKEAVQTEETNEEVTETEETETDAATEEAEEPVDDTETESTEEATDTEITTVSPSDANVAEAYTGDWNAVGTEQEGNHTTNYNSGSQDRMEIRQAVSMATGLNGNDMIEWWIENGGSQKVIATVSDSAQTETYRVYLTWNDGQGWQPTKVERLIENDKKNP